MDARTIRERLNAIGLAVATLDQTADGARHHEIAAMARSALEDIAALVTKDEVEEHRNGSTCLRDKVPESGSNVRSA